MTRGLSHQKLGQSFPSSLSELDMETIAALYELQAMAGGPKFLARLSNAKTP